MAARRCSLCGISYPTHMFKCPVHQTDADYINNAEVDDLWEWKAEAIRLHISINEGKANPIPVLTGIELREDEGRTWLSSHDLIRAGIQHRLQADDVLEINPETVPTDHPCDALWEVQAYSDGRRAYWIRPLRVPDYAPE